MKIDIEVDTKAITDGLAGLEHEMKRSFSRSIERIANDVQTDVRKSMQSNFTIAPSRQQFMRNMVKRNKEDRATPERLQAIVRIEGPRTDTSRGDILSRHEEGGPQISHGELFFLPSKEVRPTSTSLPARNLYPKALRLIDQRGIGGATDAILRGGLKGKRRLIAGVKTKLGVLRKVGLGGTFMIQRPNGTAAIFQRQGEGREGMALLWSLIPRIRLPKRLRFFETAQQSVDRTATKHMEQALDEAIKRL